jgi:hypothetical protein
VTLERAEQSESKAWIGSLNDPSETKESKDKTGSASLAKLFDDKTGSVLFLQPWRASQAVRNYSLEWVVSGTVKRVKRLEAQPWRGSFATSK